MTSNSRILKINGRDIRNYAALFSFVILAVVSTQETLLGRIEADLGTHMILEHALFFLIGALSVIVTEILLKVLVLSVKKYNNSPSYSQAHLRESENSTSQYARLVIVHYWSKFLRKIFVINKYGILWLTIAITLMTFWHLPLIFDYASINEDIHIMQHMSFIVVGACGFIAMRVLRESFNILLLFSLIGMMGFAGLMLTVTDSRVYLVYSVQSHNNAGTYMIILSIIFALIIFPAYLIHRTLFHIRLRSQDNKDM